MSQAIAYRKDVDGFRAVAVLPIILFHLGVAWVPGGYVGVDIFFVISGFLIGGISLNELRQGRFSMTAFWVRRVRRILPALTLTLMVTTIACLWLLLPVDLVKYAGSMVASSLYGANLYFYKTINYFDAAALDRPLLHLWSLGVEEQFYIFFPAVVWGTYRWARRWLPALVIFGAILSFAASVYLVGRSPNAAFYLLPTRAWEFLLGFGVTLLPARLLRAAPLREALAALGLIVVLATMLLYGATTPFPGLAALPPCLGTAAIIAAGGQGPTAVGRLLQARPLIWTGWISFSLYLWHWPLIVLTHYSQPAATLSVAQQAALLAGTYGLAWASWRWVEHPFRMIRPSPRRAFSWAVASMGLLCLAGAALIKLNGLPGRWSPPAQHFAATLGYQPEGPFRERRCFLRPGQGIDALAAAGCVTPVSGKPNVLLLGNSHGAHLWAGLAAEAPQANILQATASGWNCVPVIGLSTSPTCDGLWRHVYGEVIPGGRIDLVIISATWEAYELPALEKSLAMLAARGVPVLLVAPGPQYAMPLPRLLAFEVERGRSLAESFETASPRRFDADLRRIAKRHGAGFLSAYAALCAPHCQTVIEGTPLLFDVDHLTLSGSRAVARAIMATPVWTRAVRHRDQAAD